MKAIETFNNTNSELKRTINIVFECTLKHIEEASKVGKTHIQEDFQSTEIRDGRGELELLYVDYYSRRR